MTKTTRKTTTKSPAAKPATITMRYRAVDGASNVRKFQTIASARKFADKWVGPQHAEDCASGYAVSADGVGRVTWDGCTASDLWPVSEATTRAPKIAKPKRAKLNVTPFEAGAQIIAEREAAALAQLVEDQAEPIAEPGAPAPKVDTVISMDDFRAAANQADDTPPAIDEEPAEDAAQLQDRLEKSAPRPVAEALASLSPLTLDIKGLAAALLVSAKKDVRAYLNSVLIQRVGKALRIVSTDGHRLLVQDVHAEESPDWLDGEGLKLSAPELASALAVCGKHGDAVTIEWAVGHSHAVVHSADRFASFRIWTVEGKYPDYARIMADVDLSNQGGDALAAAQIDPAFVRGAADVAKVLGAKTLQAFTGNETRSSAFLFGGANAVMVVMPIRGDAQSTRLVTAATLAIVGGAVASSIGALRAHLTRTANALAATSDRGEIAKLVERRDSLQARIDDILRMSREALPAPAKAA